MADDPAPLAELEVITDGHCILIGKSDETSLDPLARQCVLRLHLADLITEIERQITSPLPNRVNETVAVIASERLKT